MHSVLFVATIPAQRHDWSEFVERAIQKLETAKGAIRIAENVWLLDLQQSVAPLGWLVSLAEQKGVLHGLLAFEHAPEWLPASFDPMPIQGRNVEN